MKRFVLHAHTLWMDFHMRLYALCHGSAIVKQALAAVANANAEKSGKCKLVLDYKLIVIFLINMMKSAMKSAM